MAAAEKADEPANAETEPEMLDVNISLPKDIFTPETWENLNNYSLVLRVTYGNAAFLLMGDAEAEVEETLLAAKTELAADVLVVGHHGSATSSSENFLKAVAPRYAILSVGEDNSYNLPNTGVLTRLKEQGTALYRTDLQGTVTVTSDGENLTITTAK